MNNTYRIYIHYKADTGEPFYVGRSVHQYRPVSNKNRNPYWKNTVNKHGFTVRVFGGNWTKQYASKIEQKLVKLYSRKYKLTNLTAGGDGCVGFTHKPETKRAMSLKRKGRRHTAEWKTKISVAHKKRIANGAPAPATFLTEEGRAKLSAASKLKKNKPNSKSRPVICETTGEKFECSAAAAHAYGANNANLLKHLHRQAYYKSIKGKVFSWL